MKLAVALGLVLGLSLAFVSPYRQTGSHNKYRYVIQTSKNRAEVRSILKWIQFQRFDLAGVNWNTGEIEVIADDIGLEKIHQTKLPGFIKKKQGPLQIDSTPDARYLNPQKVEDRLKAISAQFKNLTSLQKIGVSHEGRPVWALLISSTPNMQSPEYLAKPTLLVDGMHHAREVMTSEIVMDYADVILGAAVRRVPRALEVINKWNIWIVPMLNVDGNAIVWSKDSWWRKNAWKNRGEVTGVDLNRNYAYKWADCNGSSPSPSDDTYRGQNAGSEPESQGLMGLMQAIQPTAYLSYHSYGELILYPYGCDGILTGENLLHEKVARDLANILPSDAGGNRYRSGTPWQILYSVDGDSMSYAFSQFGSLSMTFEVNQEFQPPYELKAPTLEKHRKAWAAFLEKAESQLLTLKVTNQQGQSVPAQIGISNISRTSNEKVLQTNKGGVFNKVLLPGVYQFEIRSQDGKAQRLEVRMDQKPQSIHVILK